MTDWYISPKGNDGNPGTEVSPLRTLAGAHAAASDGDTIICLDGVYPWMNPQLTKNNLTIKAKNPGQAIFDGKFRE